jgi:hypothetical protein
MSPLTSIPRPIHPKSELLGSLFTSFILDIPAFDKLARSLLEHLFSNVRGRTLLPEKQLVFFDAMLV